MAERDPGLGKPGPKGQKQFIKCSHFGALYDSHLKCAGCRAKTGEFCTEQDPCLHCALWDSATWIQWRKSRVQAQKRKDRRSVSKEKSATPVLTDDSTLSSLHAPSLSDSQATVYGRPDAQVTSSHSREPATVFGRSGIQATVIGRPDAQVQPRESATVLGRSGSQATVIGRPDAPALDDSVELHASGGGFGSDEDVTPKVKSAVKAVYKIPKLTSYADKKHRSPVRDRLTETRTVTRRSRSPVRDRSADRKKSDSGRSRRDRTRSPDRRRRRSRSASRHKTGSDSRSKKDSDRSRRDRSPIRSQKKVAVASTSKPIASKAPSSSRQRGDDTHHRGQDQLRDPVLHTGPVSQETPVVADPSAQPARTLISTTTDARQVLISAPRTAVIQDVPMDLVVAKDVASVAPIIPVWTQAVPGNPEVNLVRTQALPGNPEAILDRTQVMPGNPDVNLVRTQALPGNTEVYLDRTRPRLGNPEVYSTPVRTQAVPENSDKVSVDRVSLHKLLDVELGRLLDSRGYSQVSVPPTLTFPAQVPGLDRTQYSTPAVHQQFVYQQSLPATQSSVPGHHVLANAQDPGLSTPAPLYVPASPTGHTVRDQSPAGGSGDSHADLSRPEGHGYLPLQHNADEEEEDDDPRTFGDQLPFQRLPYEEQDDDDGAAGAINDYAERVAAVVRYNVLFKQLYPDTFGSLMDEETTEEVSWSGSGSGLQAARPKFSWPTPTALLGSLNRLPQLMQQRKQPVATPLLDGSVRPKTVDHFTTAGVLGRQNFRSKSLKESRIPIEAPTN